jgi:hypothetical protein
MRARKAAKALTAAEDVLFGLTPKADDAEIAVALANFVVEHAIYARAGRGSVLVFTDCHTNRLPTPTKFDWQNANVFGMWAEDRDRARMWALERLMEGHKVYSGAKRLSTALRGGSVAERRQCIAGKLHDFCRW